MRFVDLVDFEERKCGNHRVETNGNIKRFIYYSTCIATCNEENRTYNIDRSYGSTPTSKACTQYANHFERLGYNLDTSLKCK